MFNTLCSHLPRKLKLLGPGPKWEDEKVKKVECDRGGLFKWLWVKHRVTPNWVTLVNGNKDQSNLRSISCFIFAH